MGDKGVTFGFSWSDDGDDVGAVADVEEEEEEDLPQRWSEVPEAEDRLVVDLILAPPESSAKGMAAGGAFGEEDAFGGADDAYLDPLGIETGGDGGGGGGGGGPHGMGGPGGASFGGGGGARSHGARRLRGVFGFAKKPSHSASFRALDASVAAPTPGRSRAKSRASVVGRAQLETATSPVERDFAPHLFLSTVHKQTSYESLKAGLVTLKQDIDNKTNLLRDFVRANFDRFIACTDALEGVHSQLQANENDPDGVGTRRMLETYQEIESSASQLYQSLLARNEECDRIRRTLAILRNYNYLFQIPTSIRQGIEHGDDERIRRAYETAKNAMDVQSSDGGDGGAGNGAAGAAGAGTGKGKGGDGTANKGKGRSKIVKKIMEEAERLVHDFCGRQLRRLDEETLTRAEQDRILRTLVEFDTRGDPAWVVLNKRQDRVLEQMRAATDDYKLRAISIREAQRQRTVRNEIIQAQMNKEASSGGRWRPVGDLSAGEQTAWYDELNVLTCKLVRTLTSIVVGAAPDLYHLADSILKGAFETSRGHGQDKVRDLFLDLGDSYAKRVRWAMFSETTRVPLYPFVYTCVLEIVRCKRELERLSMPPAYIKAVEAIFDDTRRFFITESCKQNVGEIGALHERETWKVHSARMDLTTLPQLFASAVMANFKTTRRLVRGPRDPLAAVIRQSFISSCRAFADSLHALAFDPALSAVREGDAGGDEDELDGDGAGSRPGSASGGRMDGGDAPEVVHAGYDPEAGNALLASTSMSFFSDSRTRSTRINRRLLLTLSNCEHTRTVVLPRLRATMRSYFGAAPTPTAHGSDADDEAVDRILMQLEGMILDRCVRLKGSELSDVLTQGLMVSGVDFAAHGPVTGISDFVLELLTETTFTHAELQLSAPSARKNILTRLATILVTHFADTVRDLDEINIHGRMQIETDVGYLMHALGAYQTGNSRCQRALAQLASVLDARSPGPLSQDLRESMEAILDEAVHETRMHLICFAPSDE